MRQQTTSGIVVGRTNFGEADRLLTVVTSDQGKLRLIARGVRKAGAKLAGSIELFNVSEITYILGRSEIMTLISARLKTHFKNIITDIERVNYGYVMLKLIDKNTEDEIEGNYFELLKTGLGALNNLDLSLEVIRLYFEANLLLLTGHAPNLSGDASGQSLDANNSYSFDPGSGLTISASGAYTAREIKFLRLVFSPNSPEALSRVDGSVDLSVASQPLVGAMLKAYLRI